MLYRLGLPPYIYGAGLNLFSNRLVGFFMHNLGAYKIDRKKQSRIYKAVIKNYARVSMERGYHNLFFPGGTRSRSGAVENKLKLGLLGQALLAYINNLQHHKVQPDIFIVPCTINYELVLEAETLIDDHLKEVGKNRYIIEDDEFSRPKRVMEFASQLFGLESRIHLVISHPLDVFGNPIDPNGRSLDDRLRPVERAQYVSNDGQPVFDPQRDREYTRETAQAIIRAFLKDTVVKPIHLLAWTVFDWLQAENPGMDLYRLLRSGGIQPSMPLTQVYQRVERVLAQLKDMQQAGKIRLAPSLNIRDMSLIVNRALVHLKSYHRRPALTRQGDRLFHFDRNLLYYYQNRLAQHGLPKSQTEPKSHEPTTQHNGRLGGAGLAGCKG
jgi:glycerol-3-phosphate O-acyltransferase